MAIENIDVANQINAAIEKQQKLLAKSTKELKDQLSIMRGIASAHEDQDFDKALKNITDMSEALDEMFDGVDDKGTRSIDELERALKKTNTTTGDLAAQFKKGLVDMFPSLAGAATGFISGMTSGLGLITKGASGAIGAITSLGAGIFSLGKSIISIPFKILGGLVDMANSLPNDTAFAQAREDIRKEFGSFSEDLALTTKTMFKQLRGELAETGLSTWRIFGNWAERLKSMHELITGMGSAATLFRDELRGAVDPRSTERILAFQKGLGISAENMKEIGYTAKISGKSMSNVLLEITKASTGFAAAFGLSQKVIARDISEMNADMGNFGSMTVHEMGRASVYVRKLGLEIKDVVGIIDKYDNFEDAAMGAAHLAQAFGANVDALDMMKEQDPTKRLDMMRKSMAAAGQDAEKMSRQELKLLAAQTGLDEKTAKVAFSLKNQGVSMDQLQKQQQRNQKNTMTQEEAMVKLASSIERMVKSGSQSGGFLTQFLQGFEKGVKYFSPFRRVLRFIHRDLRIVRWLGIETGRMFVKFFPGVNKMVQGMLEFFNPKRFWKLKEDLSGIFNGMFEGKIDLKTGLARMTAVFKDFFMGPGGAKFLQGAKEFGTTIIKWLAQGIDIGLGFIEKAINWIADFIKDPTAVIAKMKSMASSTKNPIVRMLKPLWDALAKHWQPMVAALKNLFSVIWKKLTDPDGRVIKYGKKALGGVLVTIFAPAAIQAAFGAIMGAVSKSLLGGIKSLLSKALEFGVDSESTAGGKKIVEKFFGKFGQAFTKKGSFLRFAGPIGLAIGAALSVSKGLELFYDKIEGPFDATEKKMAAAGAGLIHSFTFGLLPPELEIWIANALASVSKMFFDGLESAFGAQFVKNLKGYLEPVIDFWGSLGDLISSLISGDEKKFDKAFDELITHARDVLIQGFKFVIIDAIPMLIKWTIKGVGMLSRALTKAVSMIWDKVGDITSNAVKAVFGEKIGRGVKYVFDFVNGVYKSLSWLIMDAIPNMFANLVGWFSETANAIWDAIGGLFDKVKGWVSNTADAIWEAITKSFEGVTKIWPGVFEGLKNGWDEIVTWVEQKASIIDDKLSSVLNFGKKIKLDVIEVPDVSTPMKNSVAAAIEAAKAEAAQRGPEVATQLEKSTDVMGDKLASLGAKAAAAWTQYESTMKYKAEAKKLGGEGLSIEDMSLYQKVKDLDPDEIRASIDKFKNDVVPLFIEGDESLMGQVKLLGEKLTAEDEVAIGKVAMVSGLADRIASFASAAKSVGELSADINPIAVNIGMMNVQTSMLAMVDGVGNIATAMSDEQLIERVQIAQAKIKAVTEVVEGMVQQVNSMNRELEDAGSKKPIKVRLHNLAKNLGVKGEKFTIKNSKVNIHMNLDVRMDAENIAYSLHKGRWFQVNEDAPNGPPRRSHR